MFPALLWALPLAAQEPKIPCGYPQRDILSPFRACAEVYAPPDAVYEQLRLMRTLAERAGDKVVVDKQGRETVDHDAWRAALGKVESLGLDAGYLAAIIRTSKHGDDRDLAFYGMFFARSVDDVMNLISHIPGEPDVRIRQRAFPRAIAFMRAHLGQKFGSLTDDQKKAMVAAMPQPGSPAAKSAGITRLPRDDDHLFGNQLRLAPFIQLLDLDDATDQAQALWFLKECFLIRKDLASMWLEPALPRIRQLLVTGERPVQDEAIGLLHAIGPKNLRGVSPVQDRATLEAWATEATRELFPPIRRFSEGLLALFPSPERDRIVAAGREALTGGEAVRAQRKDDSWYSGWRASRLGEDLQPLGLPAGAVITAVNGAPVKDGRSLLALLERHLAPPLPRKLLVEFVADGESKAIEYRVH